MYIYIKRMLDFGLSAIALLVLSPLLFFIFILELLIHGKPAMYHSVRPGYKEKPFHIYKFRTMTNDRDQSGKLLPEEQRVTKFGKLLRKTSLDELPELFNMLYPEKYKRRHDVRPGLACVKLKNDGKPWTWREQFENDIFYVDNMSFVLDIKMIFAIIRTVFEADETRSVGNRAEFNGKNLDEI